VIVKDSYIVYNTKYSYDIYIVYNTKYSYDAVSNQREVKHMSSYFSTLGITGFKLEDMDTFVQGGSSGFAVEQ